ncbi:adenylyltransferase/cytidyltransferase family protein [Nanoarchaeota archaeon]
MNNKILDKDELKQIAEHLKKDGEKLVTCNGTFDLLHYGHIKFLQEAKEQGDILIVAVNSDSSVKRYKSTDRPIIPEKYRSEMLAALESVDFVIIMDEEEVAGPLLELVRPSVHCNGSDYGENCVEAEIVKKVGAKLHLIRLIDCLSTTQIISKIREE